MCCWKISPFYPYFLLSIPKLYEAPEDSPVLVMSQWEHIYIYIIWLFNIAMKITIYNR